MKKAINYWMAQGVRIPGWVLVRQELSMDAKVLYGVLLDDQGHWRNRCLQDEQPTNTHPLLEAKSIYSMLMWDQQRLIDAVQELTEFGLIEVGKYPTDAADVRRFDLCTHEWADAIVYEVEEEGEADAR